MAYLTSSIYAALAVIAILVSVVALIACGDSTPTPLTAAADAAKARGYRDAVCQIAKRLPTSLPGVAQTRDVCERSADVDEIVQAFACADDSRDRNVEIAREAEAMRQAVCAVVFAADEGPAINAARDACDASRTIREVAKAYAGSTCPSSD